MSEEKKTAYKRQILDDLFDAYVILGKGNYVSLYDLVGQMTRYSPAYVDLCGLPGEYVPVGAMNWRDWVHPEDKKKYDNIMNKLIEGTAKHYDIHYRVRLKDGSYSLMRFIGSVLRNDNTNKPELIGGITINEGLMKYTDPLTVLRNQYGFFQDISAVMELKKKCTILMIGLSKISSINERQGYSYGNRVLQQVGWFLRETFEQDGTIYRMEGSKFAILTEKLTFNELSEKYYKLRQTLSAGIQVDNMRQNLTISGGMLHIDGRHLDERAVYASLNFTCRESKLYKDGKLVNFNGSNKHNQHEFLEMIEEIRNDIFMNCEGFSLKYQSVVHAQNKSIRGAESVVKYHSERFGEISYNEFLPILERDFIFEELGYWILRQSMIDGKKLLSKNPTLVIGVNIVQVQLEDEYFIDELKKFAKTINFPLQNMCLHLSRNCRLLDTDFLKNIVLNLRSEGIRFLIDDFGSGLASIDFLRELLPDYIRFDKKYVNDLKKYENQQIIRCLSELATACGTKVFVTDINNQNKLDIIKNYSVDLLQGDLYSLPMSMPQLIEKFLNE